MLNGRSPAHNTTPLAAPHNSAAMRLHDPRRTTRSEVPFRGRGRRGASVVGVLRLHKQDFNGELGRLAMRGDVCRTLGGGVAALHQHQRR